jgi:site-specific DNA recombinase
MIAAIYCRVSTEDQEREGTSLDSQLEACVKKAQELGYDTRSHTIQEAWSGLTLDRPKLNELREWVRNKEIDAVIAYTLDRVSRDPVHFIILQDELEKAGIKLILVTETIDSSDLGKLITYIKGYAAKLEAEKIRERTMRGKRARALAGRLPANSHARLYGYTYVRGKGIGEGVRYIKENEARWVKEMYRWLVEEGLSIYAITYRLRNFNVPTPSGNGYWIRSTVHKILTNPAYMGKTYAFTQTYGEPKYRLKADTKRKKTGLIRKPRNEWLEIPNATPAIITEQLFEAAQRQLKRNRELRRGNSKRQYLLNGHIHCKRCGRSYWGKFSGWNRGSKHYERRYYTCSGNLKIVSPDHCGNQNWNADKIESLVWEQVEELLAKPEIILAQLERRQQNAREVDFLERDLESINAKLNNLNKRDEKLFRGWLWGQDEKFIEKEKVQLDREREALILEKKSLEGKIQGIKQAKIDVEGVTKACELVRQNLTSATFEEKRLALETLQIKVWVDGQFINIEGLIPLEVMSTPY